MITVSTLFGQPVNSYPTLRAVAFACEGLTDHELWELSFVDISKQRRVSWAQVKVEIGRIGKMKGNKGNHAKSN